MEEINLYLTDQQYKYLYHEYINKDKDNSSWDILTLRFNNKFHKGYRTKTVKNMFYMTKKDFGIQDVEPVTLSVNNKMLNEQLCLFENTNNNNENNSLNSVNEEIVTLRKERVKLSDERTQINAVIRRISREETIKEIAHDVAQTLNINNPFKIVENTDKDVLQYTSKKEAILQISDWHYGAEVDSPYNKYNTDICIERLGNLIKEVSTRCAKQDIEKIHIVNLSDLIQGRIHPQLRINSRIDTITQIIEVSELLANMLYALSQAFEIEYYDTLDNHSRVEPNLKDSIDLENLTRITTWFLKERLKDNQKVHIHENVFGDDIITFNILGHNVIAVHGNNDNPNTAISKLTLFTKEHYDLVLMGHVHHFSADEINETVQLTNGSLMGTDDFAQKNRLTSKPSQNLIIVTEDNVIDTIYRIVV